MICLMRTSRILKYTKSQKILLVLSVIFLLLLVPVSVKSLQRQFIQKSLAAELKNKEGLNKEETTPYAKGEIIIKLKNGVSRIITKASNKSLKIDEDGVNFDDVDPKSLPKSLVNLDSKIHITKIDKLFKGFVNPKDQLAAFKEKFKQDIEQGNRTINEPELLAIDLSGIYKLQFDSKASISEVLSILANNDDLDFAEPNYQAKTFFTPNDPYYLDTYPTNVGARDPTWNPSYDYQWDLKQMNVTQAWDFSQDSADTIIAIVDTGVDYNHTELSGTKIIKGFDFVNRDNDPMDDSGHGTHVAGIIAANTNNNTGIAGVCPNCRLIVMKALNSQGVGYDSDLSDAIYQGVINGARVINASWGGSGHSLVLQDILNYVYQNNVVFIAAAGNSNSDVSGITPAGITCATPADPTTDCTITVSATQENKTIASYSNWGTGIDVAAPGGSGETYDIISLRANNTWLGNTVGGIYTRLSGTSMASPHVAGLAGLILSKNPQLTVQQVRNIIINSANDTGLVGFDDSYGYGRVDAYKALNSMNTSSPVISKITSPLQENIVPTSFTIKGTASANNFASYKIEYANTPISPWTSDGITLANSGTRQVVNGILATANLNRPDSIYYLKLTTNAGGVDYPTVVQVKIDKSLRPNFPVKFGSRSDYQKIIVSDINNDSAGDIIFKNDDEAKIYALKQDGTNLSGWPVATGELYATLFQSNTPTVYDLDTTYPGKEIFTPVSLNASGEQILGLHADGSVLPGWSVQDWVNRGSLGYPLDTMTAGKFNNTNGVLFPETFEYNPSEGTKIRIYDKNSNSISGWPLQVAEGTVQQTPVITDLDKDGNDEMTLVYFDQTTHDYSLRIYSTNGGLVKTIPLISNTITGSIVGPVTADLDADGYPEIIAVVSKAPTSDRFLYVWDRNGNIKSASWPKKISETLDPAWNTKVLSVGDFKGDGSVEILTYINRNFYIIDNNANIFASGGNGPSQNGRYITGIANVLTSTGVSLIALPWSTKIYLYAFDPVAKTFTVVNGYPKDFKINGTTSIYDGIVGTPVLTDLDNNNNIELITTYSNASDSIAQKGFGLYVFNLGYLITKTDWPQYLNNESHSSNYKTPLRSISAWFANENASITTDDRIDVYFPGLPCFADGSRNNVNVYNSSTGALIGHMTDYSSSTVYWCGTWGTPTPAPGGGYIYPVSGAVYRYFGTKDYFRRTKGLPQYVSFLLPNVTGLSNSVDLGALTLPTNTPTITPSPSPTPSCTTPNYPTNITPSGTIISNGSNMSVVFKWNAVPGVSSYAFRIDDQANLWCDPPVSECYSSQYPNCAKYSGDYCNDNVTTNQITRTLQAGHTYKIWVHSISPCGAGWSNPSPFTYLTLSGITQTPTPTPPALRALSSWYANENSSVTTDDRIDVYFPGTPYFADGSRDKVEVYNGITGSYIGLMKDYSTSTAYWSGIWGTPTPIPGGGNSYPINGAVYRYYGTTFYFRQIKKLPQYIKFRLPGVTNYSNNVNLGPLYLDDFNDNLLSANWIIKNGTWSETGGVVKQTSISIGDPKKLILSNSGINFLTNQTVTAKVRVDTWSDGDSARAGVSIFTNTNDGTGYNFVFHNNHSTVQFLDDYIVWGPAYTFNWTNGVWYWFQIKNENGTLYAKVWQDGTTEPTSWPYTWARSGRTGYPALNGGSTRSTGSGNTTSFDYVYIE